jgi:hypothetical protein
MRVVGVLASMVSGLYLLYVLGFGAMWVTTDWSGFGCFDGNEPACAAPRHDPGLGDVQATSWVMGAAAVAAVIAAFVLSVRMKRAGMLPAVLALCVFAAASGATLYGRLF